MQSICSRRLQVKVNAGAADKEDDRILLYGLDRLALKLQDSEGFGGFWWQMLVTLVFANPCRFRPCLHDELMSQFCR